MTASEVALPRRRFVALAAAGFAAGCASASTGRAGGIALQSLLDPLPGSAGRPTPPLLSLGSTTYSTFAGHVTRRAGSGYTLGGIDYGPLPGHHDTEVCAVAAGVVIGSTDHSGSGGVRLTIGHGLGWKTEYNHLKLRLATYRQRVRRGERIAVMGASGTGASRVEIGGPAVHLHLTLWGPAWTPLYDGIEVQNWPGRSPGFTSVLDPEDFSIAGAGRKLPYARPGDEALDNSFLGLHAEAVKFCDDLLDRLSDGEAARTRARERWEQETRFEYQVDRRIWFLWQRLEQGSHPFTPAQVVDYRAIVSKFMQAVPRLTAPVLERR